MAKVSLAAQARVLAIELRHCQRAEAGLQHTVVECCECCVRVPQKVRHGAEKARH